MMIAAALVALGTAGCGEREQSALYKDGKYRGKTDTRPWDNAPAATSTGSWSKGDQASWENQLRSRHVTAQNENHRIGH
jgi:hypothetical protein